MCHVNMAGKIFPRPLVSCKQIVTAIVHGQKLSSDKGLIQLVKVLPYLNVSKRPHVKFVFVSEVIKYILYYYNIIYTFFPNSKSCFLQLQMVEKSPNSIIYSYYVTRPSRQNVNTISLSRTSSTASSVIEL